MTPQLTPEQLRMVDAAVAECMGLNVVATEWLCMSGYGRPTEAYRVPDYNEPPWFIYMKGRPSSAETIRPVYVPEDGQWPPEKVTTARGEEIWLADVQVVPEYSTNHNDWAQVERWMLDNFTRENKFDYWIAMRTSVVHPISEVLTYFASMTAPLPLRCLAFLSAMGKDVEEILKEKADEQS